MNKSKAPVALRWQGLVLPQLCGCFESRFLPFRLNLLDYFRNEEGENKQPYGEEYFKGKEFSPVSGDPDILQRPYEEGEDKSSHDDAQACPRKVIPKTHFGEAHAEIHGGKGEIDKPQVKSRSKAVPLNGVVIFFELISDQRGGKFSSKGATNPKSSTGPGHGPKPDIDKAPIGPENGSAQPG